MIVKTDNSESSLEFDQVNTDDAEVIEEVFGVTFPTWLQSSTGPGKNPGTKDMRAIVFLARRQSGEPALKFADVRFLISSFDVENTDAEKASIAERAAIEAAATNADGSVDPTSLVSSETAPDLAPAAETTPTF